MSKVAELINNWRKKCYTDKLDNKGYCESRIEFNPALGQCIKELQTAFDQDKKDSSLTMQEVKNWVTGDCDPSCCADLCDCPTTWNIDQITRMVRNG